MKEAKKEIMPKGFKRLYWFMVLPVSLYLLFLIEGLRVNLFVYNNNVSSYYMLRIGLVLFFIISSFYLFRKSLKANNRAHLILLLMLIFLNIIILIINLSLNVNLVFAGIWGLFIIVTPFYYGGTAMFLALEFYKYLKK